MSSRAQVVLVGAALTGLTAATESIGGFRVARRFQVLDAGVQVLETGCAPSIRGAATSGARAARTVLRAPRPTSPGDRRAS
jgi:hypothetical protein